MRGRSLGLLLLAACLAGRPAQAGGPGIPRAPEFEKRVAESVERGVRWLAKQQARDGAFPPFPGYPGATTAFAYHTLRVCGTSKDDPAAKKAWTAMRRDASPASWNTYTAALLLMAAAEKGRVDIEGNAKLDEADFAWAAGVAARLADGQTSDGGWGYPVGPVGGGGLGRYSSGDHDLSNTQFALLGLKSAARCGIAIDESVWRKSLGQLMRAQEPRGPAVARGPVAAPPKETAGVACDHARGWDYTDGTGAKFRGAYASMTAGGVSSVVLCRSELLEKRALAPDLAGESDRSARDGLAWLGTRWKLPPDPKDRKEVLSSLDCYAYYGVERAGVLAGVERMAALDWYGAGAAVLVEAQDADGSWLGLAQGISPDEAKAATAARRVIDTCFVLLFLERGTTPVRYGAVTPSDGDADIDFTAAANATGQDLDDFLDFVLARWQRAGDAAVRTRLLDGATSVGPRIVPPLLARLGAADAGRRANADALLRHATGLDQGYDPGGADADREAALARWQAWWKEAGKDLVYDAATRRLAARPQ